MPTGLHRLLPRALVCTLLLGSVAFVPGQREAEALRDGTKRALIITISEYGSPPPHPATGAPLRPYRPLNAANDVALVQGALEQQGFATDDIRVLRDAEADVEGIRAALERLVRDTDPGDVVVLHYSGHGHRITNDNPEEDDEVDGYDEVLVPYGAPDEFYDGYEGSLHIRDDEIGAFVGRLRSAAGSTGNVTIFLDACYSGTGTRGGPDLPARGSEEPLGPPVGARSIDAASNQGGTGVDAPTGPATRGRDDDLASFVVLSAASQRQVAYETWDVDGKTRVGSLSYAIARTLPLARPGTTYRALFAEMTRSLSGKVMQTPQMEGDTDASVFSGQLVQQAPHVVVLSVEESDGAPRRVSLAAGALAGLNPGTRLLVHASGATRPDPETAIATLRVTDVSPTGSTAEIEGRRGDTPEAGDWAFVTERTYGDLSLRVRLADGLLPRDVAGLERVLGGTGIIDIVEEGADVVIQTRGALPVARTVADDLELGVGAVDVVEAVENFARNRYLRRLSFDTEELAVAFELAPVEIERDALGRATGCAPASWDPASHPGISLGGDQWSLAVGSAYRLRAVNAGERRVFVALLDLLPLGAIRVLRPRDDEAASSYELEVGAEMDLGCYQLSDEAGNEVLKLFATRTPQDFRAMFETRGTRGGNGSTLGALEAVVASTYTETRSSDVGQPTGAATTRSITIRVRPN